MFRKTGRKPTRRHGSSGGGVTNSGIYSSYGSDADGDGVDDRYDSDGGTGWDSGSSDSSYDSGSGSDSGGGGGE
jgi:hypothetical protein